MDLLKLLVQNKPGKDTFLRELNEMLYPAGSEKAPELQRNEETNKVDENRLLQ